jgi:hypothetical protein
MRAPDACAPVVRDGRVRHAYDAAHLTQRRKNQAAAGAAFLYCKDAACGVLFQYQINLPVLSGNFFEKGY